MGAASSATAFSVALLADLIDLGVRHVVLSPGSRSQALALAAVELERAGRVTLHVRIDERSAAFLALGLAVESGEPTVVITTSGTAVANLHPAVLEAHHSGVPLILLTADRPPELRGIGSNQTTQQHGIFGPAVRFVREVEAPGAVGFDTSAVAELAHEAYSAAAGHSDAPGPVQLNLAYREPLSGPVGPLPVARGAHRGAGLETGAADGTTSTSECLPRGSRERPLGRSSRNPSTPHTISAAPNTVVVAGHAAGEQAEALARALGAPLLAEVSSGARFGPNLVVSYRELLDDEEFGGRIERVVVFGHPTLSREIPALIQRDGVRTIVVRGLAAENYNPGHRVGAFVDAIEVEGPPDTDRSWLGRWVHASRALAEASDDAPVVDAPDARDGSVTAQFQRQTLAALRAPVSRRGLVDAVWRVTWPHDRLVLGASRLIRETDRAVPGKKIRVHANRGLAGIDGTVSTAVGIALASQVEGRPGVTRLLLGDLTLLHEPGGLLLGAGEARPRIQIIVGNDGGGTIFDGLEVAATAEAESFDRVLFTPQGVELAALAQAYGWQHVRAANRGDLDAALTASAGPTLIEVPLTR
ncbi:2-succinyl-5-enolpyruvyl-6-hydroxy-3-cyclohexene-1-carboxylate synthase [Homoserinimonas aerilata]|uniref:2-succinyl-5-enolpyruvyl-6-hydroxy-3-cyclohexene-1-carboxylate synthase n=1 Tax=Homoserinimonas aerilata TaxID=1162970 RepID=A0A542YAF3_9MICO|nr:2-succinyl-5-enolpyruvyl-6-hydroxy-3-cyclohexene-1-carboxylic-acid synthase [Homoserinimonas aerilata]TQL44992.1 2-succinyl-5-enolpyruvyl-6-hydroxy-3-cyclohexene-1-carboxylate synthase [Homoserinimonas aerilata]